MRVDRSNRSPSCRPTLARIARVRIFAHVRRCVGAAAAGIMLCAGCAVAPKSADWSAYDGPGAEHFRKEEYRLPYTPDPLEPTNRIVWAVNDFILFDLVEPVSAGWRFIVPQGVRSHLVTAAKNITYPVRLISNLLQGRFGQAGNETQRFVINSTVGVLGLFDEAAEWGIKPAPEDLGRTFVRWGWTDSPYLILPVVGPSSVRDALGLAGDTLLDPTTYYFPAGVVKGFVEGSEVIGDAKRAVRTNYDAYAPARYAWAAARWLDGMEFEELTGDGPASDTLGFVSLTYHDPWFPAGARRLAVALPSTGKKLPYDAWIQRGPAPIVYFVPGAGAHRESRHVLALAEMAYARGCSVVTISSAMNFEFMETAATVAVPGFAPADAHDVHVALDAISRDLKGRFPNRIGAEVLMGMSLGAFHGIYIAAGADPSHEALLAFDRWILLNPPVSLRYAAEQLDAYYNVPLTFPESQRDDHVRAILHRALQAVRDGASGSGGRFSFFEEESRFLVGVDFRVLLHDAIWNSQRRLKRSILKNPLNPLRRAPVSNEILDYSFLEYFYAFVLPCCQQRERAATTADEMFWQMDARSIADSLPSDGTVRVFSSDNDFLVSDADRLWLIQTFGQSNVDLEPRGGHTGALTQPETQRRIMDSLEDLLTVRDRADD